MKRTRLFLWLVAALVAAAVTAFFLDPTLVLRGLLLREPFYRGRPVSYWRKALKSEDPVAQEDAVRSLKGGDSSAVVVLVALLNEKGASSWDTADVRWKAADLLGQLGPKAGD